MDKNKANTQYSGLIVKWYDKLLENETRDIDFYKKLILLSGQPVLEIGCGTGRILLPLKENGVDIDGVDNSKEMLDLCAHKLKEKELESSLFCQDAASMNLSRKYATIFFTCGSFQLIEDFKSAMRTLENIYKNLLPGGKFISDLYIPWKTITVPQDGVSNLTARATNETGEILLTYESSYYNLTEQEKRVIYKYELYHGEQIKEILSGENIIRWYGKNEFIMMLKQAGFSKVQYKETEILPKFPNTIIYLAYK